MPLAPESNRVTVNEYMHRNAKTIPASATLKEAGKAMVDHQISALLVVHEGQYVGIISDKRLAREGAAQGLDPEKTLVSTIMRRDILTIRSDQPIKEAQTFMKENGVRHLVVTEQETIIGIVSISDLIRYYTDYLENQ